MEGPEHDEADLLRAIAESPGRVLFIGRRALIMLGAPVLTNDYDLWIAIDDIVTLNDALAAIGLYPNKPPVEARRTGRYLFENDLRVDVLVARFATTPDGLRLDFEDAWARRQNVAVAPGLSLSLPSIPDLITTKRWASRAKDMVDIQWLEVLARRAGGR